MDYPLEQLTPERFQQLCQALLVKEMPGIQCFPVAQPDGGRDAVMYAHSPEGRSFAIYQVKFVRQAMQVQDVTVWLKNIIESELEKISSLVPLGATKFILITNVPGTAHLGTGRIDLLQQALDSTVPVPAEGWWRDDLSRRLDNAWDLKWSYPELMTGPDLIRSIIEAGLREDGERRANAVRAYIRDQYDRDLEVKFKQVELQNKLLDLFIDVPISPPFNQSSRRQHMLLTGLYHHVARGSTGGPSDLEVVDVDFGENHGSENRQSVGAGSFLLNSLVQRYLPRAVLEGAPGQGKSTISQYICQIHRMRILKLEEILQQVSEDHRSGPTRLPFKIDLRDFATWLGGANPFSGEASLAIPSNWHKSLEAFLAAHIANYSGGVSFTTSDLLAVARISAMLLVFDGLDEVADIAARREVIEEIVKGVGRLEANSISLQVLVTSRPAAFANSPGLPEPQFPYFQLDSVTRPLIDLYSEKWLKSRKLRGREAAEVRKILRERLEEPHIRDLARNPMQLAILLSLVHTRGSSLPDKRTALYDSYIELFFNREAEKSEIVRTHRDLLINIHRYLGWVLHSEAEKGVGNGIVSEERLHKLLQGFLTSEGHDSSLAGVLFEGMVERVVALVSRVQGTYEFEVQPLREYFAGRFLYETAPYSPPGNERTGTKPERFDALARNFYWTNVTRFYAGCYSVGELASLIDRLQDLVSDPIFGHTSHARILAATLLSDWVFTQHPKSVKEVIRLVLDGIGLRFLITSVRRRAGVANPLLLPEQSGRRELVARCLETLQENPPREYTLDLIDILKANTTIEEASDIFVSNHLRQQPRDRWLEIGWQLGTLPRVGLPTLIEVLGNRGLSEAEIEVLFRAKRFDYLESSDPLFLSAMSAVLGNDWHIERPSRKPSPLELISYVLSTFRYATVWSYAGRIPLETLWRHQSIELSSVLTTISPSSNVEIAQSLALVKNVCITVALEAQRPAGEWASELQPWESLVGAVRENFGEVWAAYRLANLSAGIRSRNEKGTTSDDLYERSISLPQRARYARLRGSNLTWWRATLATAPSSNEKAFAILLLFTWVNTKTINQLCDELSVALATLEAPCWSRLYETVGQATFINREFIRRNVGANDREEQWADGSPRLAALLGFRSTGKALEQLVLRNLEFDGSDSLISQFIQGAVIRLIQTDDLNWSELLPVISRTYYGGAMSGAYTVPRLSRDVNSIKIPMEIAIEVTRKAYAYPAFIVAMAESVITEHAALQTRRLENVAVADGWFTDRR